MKNKKDLHGQMINLFNLLAAVALLVCGTGVVRTGVIRILRGNLGQVLASSLSNRFKSVFAALAVTRRVQSSTATAVIISPFVPLTILLPAQQHIDRIRDAQYGVLIGSKPRFF